MGQVVRDKYPDFDTFGKVRIGGYCYIGTGSQIMPGVTLGNNVLVAAGSIVTKSVPSGFVVGGNPAKIICSIDDYIRNNIDYNLRTKDFSYRRKQQFLLGLPEEKFIRKGVLAEQNKPIF